TEGNAAAPYARLDLGAADARSGDQLVLIHTIKLWGPFSPIHLLSIFTLIMVPLGVWRAHHHQVKAHRSIMIGVFSGALVVAGLLTLLPGRIMHMVVFGS